MSHNYSKEEVYSFTQYINVHLKKNRYVRRFLPMDPNSDDLFEKLWASQGLLLYQLIFSAAKDPKSLKHHFVKFRVLDKENIFYSLSNIQMCLEAAKELGIKIIGISQDNFQRKEKYLVLGVVWQLIRKCLCNKVEYTNQQGQYELKQEEIEPIILAWAGEITQKQGEMVLFAEGDNILTLMTKIGQDCLVDIPQIPSNASERDKIEAAFKIAEKIGIENFLRPEDFQQKNSKLVFSFLAEVFSASIRRELAVGYDSGQQKLQKCYHAKSIQSGFYQMIVPMNFNQGLRWDVSRAGGQLDVAETCILALETLKGTSMTDDFLNETIYGFLMADLSESDYKQLVVQTVRDVRDGIDELMQKSGQDERIRVLTSCLMTLASDDETRIEIAHTDFESVFKRLMDRNTVAPFVFVPISFYGAAMDEENTVSTYYKLQEAFYQRNFEYHFAKLKYTEQCALLYSLSRQDALDSAVFKAKYAQLINYLFTNVSESTVQNAAFLYNCMQFSSLNFDQKLGMYQKAVTIANEIEKKDVEHASLLRQQNAQLMLYLLQEKPKDALIFVEKTGLVKQILLELEDYGSDRATDKIYQRNLLTTSVLLHSIKQASAYDGCDAAQRIRAQLSTSNNDVDYLYNELVENYLGNETIRQAARNNVEALLNTSDQALVDDFIDILQQCAKSSSQTAFVQSLRDIQIIAKTLTKNYDRLIEVFDLVLAGMAKFSNELVLSEVLSTFACFATHDGSFVVTSKAICELNEEMTGWIANKAVLSAYLLLIEVICKDPHACLPLLSIVHENLARIPYYHSSADIIIKYYAVLNQISVSGQAAAYFCDYLRFFSIVLQHLAEGIQIAKAAAKSCALVISKGYTICQQAFDRNVFEKLRIYAKGYKDKELAAIVKEAHAVGQYYLAQLQEDDVNRELCAL